VKDFVRYRSYLTALKLRDWKMSHWK